MSNYAIPHQLIEITRADYEAAFGLKTDPGTIGARLYGQGSLLLQEYLFVGPDREIQILEDMYRL